MARWLPEGNIEFLGRKDHQIKIRGFRIELGEIENLLLNHEAVKEVVVDVVSTGDQSLCAYIVVDREFETTGTANAGEFREYLSRMLPDYMIPSYFVFLEKLPLTSSGKVDRKSLPEPDIGPEEEEYVAPRTLVEAKLAEIWSDILKIDKSKIGIDTSFFNIGGQSLKATVLISEIHKQLNVKIPLVEVFKTPTIRELSRFIGEAEISSYTPIEKAPVQEYYPLSFAQRRLWVLCQFEEDSTAYNMPWVFAFSGQFDVEAFTKAVQAVADRHESLRTVFVVVEGEPNQKIIRDFRFQLEQEDLRKDASGIPQEIEEKTRKLFVDFANSAFDLEKSPLFRFKLVRMEAQRYLLMFNIHHIITDGWSTGTLFNEMIILYNAFLKDQENPLPPLHLQYKDYSAWHNALIEEGSFDHSGQYWLEKLSDKPNGIELPLDHPRGVIQTFNGGRVPFVIDEEKTLALHRIGREEDVTLFMVLLSLVNLFMYRYTGQEDILIGSPIAGRRSPELHPLVGFLVNTLVYRNRVEPSQTFRHLLANIKKEALECFEYQDYPFDLLVERLELDRDLSHSPLFNVMLAHNNAETEDTNLVVEGVQGERYPYSDDFNMSKFDLIFFMDEFANHIIVRIEYNSDLFERSTIERMKDNFLALTEDVIVRSDVPVSALHILSEAEYRKVIQTFNDTRYSFPSLSLQELFEQRVEACRDKIAVVSLEQSEWRMNAGAMEVTYNELNKKVNQLAHFLRQDCGVKPNEIIAVSMDRSIDMIVVILGIIKSGAAYLAVDPYYPKDRISYMLRDSNCKWMILDKWRSELCLGYNGNMIIYKSRRDEIASKPLENPLVVNKPTDILYITYTSGSTGIPNGAAVCHDTLRNLVQWQNENTNIDGSLRCLQFASINFDVSFQEIMTTLTSGGELNLIGEMERKDMDYLMDFLVSYRIELLYLPFYYLNFLFSEPHRWGSACKHSLKHIITAGEQLIITPGLQFFLDLNRTVQLHNHYGPAEMHAVTSYTLDFSTADNGAVPPIGTPISNTRIYILDEHHRLVPIGVYGELYIAGCSDFLGYINKPDITRRKLLTYPQFSLGNNNKTLYATSDICRWLEDGNIEIKGRKDFQVKIRGFRIEPGEIESKIIAIDGVKDCIVVARDWEGEKYLVAYIVAAHIDAREIKAILGNDLPQYMMPRIVFVDSIPLLPNGKVDRDRLPDPGFIGDELGGYVPPENDIQGELAAIWSELLGIEADRIGIDDNFFEKGGHSLKATTMMSKIHKELNVRVDLSEIFKTPTIRDLARLIEELTEDVYTPIEPMEQREYYALSSAQKRLYIMWQLAPDSIAYNLTSVVVLNGHLDRGRLESTFWQMIERHESLRTSFQMVQKNPVQKIRTNDQVEFAGEYYNLSSKENEERVRESRSIIRESLIRPFDLSQAPLLRVGLIKLSGEDAAPRYILMVDMHHIIADGTSLGIFIKDFVALYSGQELPELRLQYRDFAEWQTGIHQNKTVNKSIKQQEQYWLNQFEGDIPQLAMPTDFPRPPIQDFEGDIIDFEIDEHWTAEIKKLVVDAEATIYMILLAVYNILLSKYTLQEDIVVGTGVAGRQHTDLETIIGMFVNMLPMRNYPGAGKSFNEFLQEVKKNAINAFDNQGYQFEELVDKLDIPRDSSKNPIFDAEFTMQNIELMDMKVELPGFQLEPFENVGLYKAKFDLVLEAIEGQKKIYMTLTYSTKLFERSTVEKIGQHYQEVLQQVLENREILSGDIQLSHKLSAVTDVVSKEKTLFDF